jgi:hypothetical protein
MNVEITPEAILLTASVAAAIGYGFKKLRSVFRTFDQIETAVTEMSYQWQTNGKTGMRDTMTHLLEVAKKLETEAVEARNRGNLVISQNEALLEEQVRVKAELKKIVRCDITEVPDA